MKIKTIWSENPSRFDERVNNRLAEGWGLVKREVLPATNLADSVFYAELVQLDPVPEVPEPQPMGPMDAVRAIKEACLATPSVDCNTERCPLKGWCDCLAETSDPSDWKVSEKVAEA